MTVTDRAISTAKVAALTRTDVTTLRALAATRCRRNVSSVASETGEAWSATKRSLEKLTRMGLAFEHQTPVSPLYEVTFAGLDTATVAA